MKNVTDERRRREKRSGELPVDRPRQMQDPARTEDQAVKTDEVNVEAERDSTGHEVPEP